MGSILDFSNTGYPAYSLMCVNQSEADWQFYLFQTMPGQTAAAIYSLAWLVCPYRLTPQSYVTFKWSVDWCITWQGEGRVAPGIAFDMGGGVRSTPDQDNGTTFTFTDQTPKLSTPTPQPPMGKFQVTVGPNVPADTFAVGIGMSYRGAFAKQAEINTTQAFDPGITYGVGAAQTVASQQVLTGDPSNTSTFSFPINVYQLVATLGKDNLWSISEGPMQTETHYNIN